MNNTIRSLSNVKTLEMLNKPYDTLTEDDILRLHKKLQWLYDSSDRYNGVDKSDAVLENKVRLMQKIKNKLLLVGRPLKPEWVTLGTLDDDMPMYWKPGGVINTVYDKEVAALFAIIQSNPYAVYTPIFQLTHADKSVDERLIQFLEYELLPQMIGPEHPLYEQWKAMQTPVPSERKKANRYG